jgi:type II secretory pathway pseudopilin PulG
MTAFPRVAARNSRQVIHAPNRHGNIHHLKSSRTPYPTVAAYTLIELTVVMFLIGLMLALTVPQIQTAFLADDLKTATRRMIGAVKTLRESAIREQKDYKLYFDVGSSLYWVEWVGMTDDERSEAREKASGFPGDVRIVDVARQGKEKKTVGDAVIRFNKKGYVEYSVIHLGTPGDRVCALVVSPFLGTIKTYDAYVEL